MRHAGFMAGSMILLASTFGTAAGAEETAGEKGDRCISAENWANLVHDKSTGVAIQVLVDIEGLEARQVVERVNAEPPRTHMAADHVLVLGAKAIETQEPQPYVLVAFFNQGCLVASGRADPEGIANLIEGEST